MNKKCKQILEQIWINIQIAWELKWELLLAIVIFGFFALFFIGLHRSINNVIDDPEKIGSFFGKISNGFLKEIK